MKSSDIVHVLLTMDQSEFSENKTVCRWPHTQHVKFPKNIRIMEIKPYHLYYTVEKCNDKITISMNKRK